MTHALGTDAGLDESIGWLLENTNFPTFAEFSKNPDKWRANKDDLFEAIQNSSHSFKISKQRYFWRGIYEVDSLEKIQKIAEEEGFSGSELEMQPIARERITDDPRKTYEIDVNIWPKGEFKAQGGIVANE